MKLVSEGPSIHTHIAGGDSNLCDFSLDGALVSFVWVTVQIKATTLI